MEEEVPEKVVVQPGAVAPGGLVAVVPVLVPDAVHLLGEPVALGQCAHPVGAGVVHHPQEPAVLPGRVVLAPVHVPQPLRGELRHVGIALEGIVDAHAHQEQVRGEGSVGGALHLQFRMVLAHEGLHGGVHLRLHLGGGRGGLGLAALAGLPGLVLPGRLGPGLAPGLGVAGQGPGRGGQDQDEGRGGAAVPHGRCPCSAFTRVRMPPRMRKSPSTCSHWGARAATRSSRIWLVTASWKAPRSRKLQR